MCIRDSREGALDLGEHRVERAGQRGDLVVGGTLGHPSGQVPTGDRRRGVLDLAQRPERPADGIPAEERAGEEDDSNTLRFHDLELDEIAHEVRRGGVAIDVSPTEFKLLRYLMLNPNRVLSKTQILDHVWDYDFRGEAGIVESYISYLRRKIDSVAPPLIHTKRGVGYVLRLPPS